MTQRFTSKEVNVPLGMEFALVDDDGLVIATVMWLEDYDTGILTSQVYAPNEKAAHKIPPLSPDLGEWYKQRARADVLMEYREISPQGAYRIDCMYEGVPNSYRINVSDGRSGIAQLKTQTVYRLRRNVPHRLSFSALKALVSHPDALIMNGQSKAGLISEGAEETMRVMLGFASHPLVVWDEAAMYRSRSSFSR